MPKRITISHSYTNAMTAEFMQSEEYPMHTFFESEIVNVNDVLKFKCTSSLNNMMKQDFIDSNAGSVLISERLKGFLLNVLPTNSVQFIESSLKCKDGKIEGLYLINSLLTDDIIDIKASKKEYFSFSPNEFILDRFGIVFNKNIMLIPQIARHDNKSYDTDLFFSDSLVQLIKQNNFDRNMVFY